MSSVKQYEYYVQNEHYEQYEQFYKWNLHVFGL